MQRQPPEPPQFNVDVYGCDAWTRSYMCPRTPGPHGRNIATLAHTQLSYAHASTLSLGGKGGGQDIVYKLLSCSCLQLRCNNSSSHRLEASFASRLLVILVGRAARFLQYCWHGVEFHSSDPRRDKAYQQPRCSGPVSVRHCGPSRAQQGHHIPAYESLEAETREGVQTEVGMAPRFDEAAD